VSYCKCGIPIDKGDMCLDCLYQKLTGKQSAWISNSKLEEPYRRILHRKKMRPQHHT
jgi:hypothetical protein